MSLTAAAAYTEFNEAIHNDIRSYMVILDGNGKSREANQFEGVEKGEKRLTISFHTDGSVRVARFRDGHNKHRENFDVTTFRKGMPTRTEHMQYDPDLYNVEIEEITLFSHNFSDFSTQFHKVDGKDLEKIIEKSGQTKSTESVLKQFIAENTALEIVYRNMTHDDREYIRSEGGVVPNKSTLRE